MTMVLALLDLDELAKVGGFASFALRITSVEANQLALGMRVTEDARPSLTRHLLHQRHRVLERQPRKIACLTRSAQSAGSLLSGTSEICELLD
ncbi:hypothetical protein QCM80_38570 [Bradyrhizobium sp. SSUT112]|uniref:hypothetical protein n=1 Tax=Bradyrhizobium sp. SSUT112 TaxID=3040604 RepID=UPI002447E496|nr:hypothetical protein [Bradyrhizobium sp. SSUT112]MDH2356505.1 hypothetical protein [Bradyrhizobium sp. SSUT112]